MPPFSVFHRLETDLCFVKLQNVPISCNIGRLCYARDIKVVTESQPLRRQTDLKKKTDTSEAFLGKLGINVS